MKRFWKFMEGQVDAERNSNPFLKYYSRYVVIFGILFWADYSFLKYRILSNTFFYLLPIIGTITMYLWFVFISDEFLDVIKSRGKLVLIVKRVKRLSIIFIISYGLAALVLWINGISASPVRMTFGSVSSLEDTNLGLIRFQWATVVLKGRQKLIRDIVLTSDEKSYLYAGMDIKLVIRKGILGLDRILEVDRDDETYYLKNAGNQN